jgi:diacylglycerol kinase family enzyme
MPEPLAKADAPPRAERPRLRKLAAVVNAASGSVGPGAAAQLASLVSGQGLELSMAEPAPGEIETAVRAAVDAAPDLLIILAGDGTARRAAELSGPDGPLIAPLAGGTMNVLPHALYGVQLWTAALAQILEGGVERVVGGGRLDGHAFYVAAILGAPALWGSVREAVRAGRFDKAGRGVRYALARAFSGDLHYVLDGRPSRQTEALVLITPTVSTALHGEAAALEAASLDIRGADQVVGLAFNGLTGDWRRDSRVSVETCERGRAQARRPIPCILDGEIQSVGREIAFSFEPRAFRALVPAARNGA